MAVYSPRAWHFGYPSSRDITEVKQGVAMLVLGWVTAWCFQSCPSLAIGMASGGVQWGSYVMTGQPPLRVY